jgi:hypothetical protein
MPSLSEILGAAFGGPGVSTKPPLLPPVPNRPGLSTYEPTWRDNITGAIASVLPGSTNSFSGFQRAKDIMSGLDWTGAGSAIDVADAVTSGDPDALAMAAIGAIPGGGAAKKGAKNAVEKAAKELPEILSGAVTGAERTAARTEPRVAAAAANSNVQPAELGDVFADAVAKLPEPNPARFGSNKPNVDGTWGDLDRPDLMFEGVPPSQFTPGQWGRYGEAMGAHNIGPADEDAWYASLKPFSNTEGRQFYIPGGLEDKTPFTYWDDLYMKSQGINPATLDEATRTAIHNRTVAGKGEPPEGWRDENIANQFLLGMTSPNNPLTPNEFAVAAAHVKGPEDLKRLAEVSGMDYDKSSNYLGTQKAPAPGTSGSPYSSDDRQAKSLEIMDKTGVGAGSRGGMGVGGSGDWTRISDMAQMMREKPDFFRFKGAGEGGKSHEENWANFVDRIITQVPGLKAKTGAFSAVWQDPAKAGVSAIDRHMLAIIRDNVFETPEAAAKWNADTIKKWNKGAEAFNKDPKNKAKRATITSIDDLAKTPGGTEYFNEEMFKTVNNPAEPKMRTRAGDVSLSVPEHLKPENADYVKEPLHATAMSPGYKRGLQDVSKQAARPGSTGLFSDQWYLWDPQRQRFEPHEVMQPGLIDLQRMSHEQQKEALAAHADAGYLNYGKDEAGKLQPVQPVPFAEGADVPLSAGREKMRQQLRGLNPSRLAAFAATGAVAAGLVEEELARRREESGPRIDRVEG